MLLLTIPISNYPLLVYIPISIYLYAISNYHLLVSIIISIYLYVISNYPY